MARPRADADQYSEADLETIHAKLPKALAKAIRLKAVEEEVSIAVLLRRVTMSGWESLYGQLNKRK